MANIVDKKFDYYAWNGASLKRVTPSSTEGWRIAGEETGETALLELYARRVPWLARAMDLVSWGVKTVPLVLMRGDVDIATTDDWSNKEAQRLLPDVRKLVEVVARALTLYGNAYAGKLTNAAKYGQGLRYYKPSTIDPDFSQKTGELLGFKRNVNGQTLDLKTEQLVYFWPASEQVETGPSPTSPALAALTASGLIYNIGEFGVQFLERGAIKVTILAVPQGTQADQRTKLQDWWDRVVRGRSNAFTAHVLEADAVKPTVIGEGLKELEKTPLTDDAREAVAAALGIPHSLLMANAANFATAQMDRMNFYELTVTPRLDFICDIITDQYLKAEGYKLQPRAQSLDVFHEDENARAGAYSSYVGSGMLPSIAAQICGIELPDGVEYEDLDPEDEPEPEPQPAPVVVPEMVQEEEPDMEEEELKRWQRKALKALKAGKSPAVEFESDVIQAETHKRIMANLQNAKTADEVKAAFWIAPAAELARLASALEKAYAAND